MKEIPAAFARRLGVHKATVSRAIAAGRLTLVDGAIDVEQGLRQWQESRSGSRPDVAARHAAKRRPPAPTITEAPTGSQAPAAAAYAAPEDEDLDDGQPQTMQPQMQHYTAARIGAQNNLLKLAILLRTHKRYPLDAIRAEGLAFGGMLRAALERLVDQTAPRLALLADDQARQQLLADEAGKLRRDMRRELPRAMRRLRAGGASRGGA